MSCHPRTLTIAYCPITYTYDAVGNRLVQGDAGKVTTYTYDIANRLTSASGIAYTWDNNGNLLADDKSTYTYDQLNRLTKVVTGTQTYTMTYNGLGDRLTLSVNGTQTKYANDVAGGLTQVLLETTGATKNFYLYGNGLIAQQKSFVQYFGLDGLGSVRQLYNSSGQIVSDRQFDPYGNQMSKTGVGTSIYGFTGEQMDGSGLVYLRARYYAPRQGRFTTRDTWAGDYTRPATMNGWDYGENNPVNATDPSGRCVNPASVDVGLSFVPWALTQGSAIFRFGPLDSVRQSLDQDYRRKISYAIEACRNQLEKTGQYIQNGDVFRAESEFFGFEETANEVLNGLDWYQRRWAGLTDPNASYVERLGPSTDVVLAGLNIATALTPVVQEVGACSLGALRRALFETGNPNLMWSPLARLQRQFFPPAESTLPNPFVGIEGLDPGSLYKRIPLSWTEGSQAQGIGRIFTRASPNADPLGADVIRLKVGQGSDKGFAVARVQKVLGPTDPRIDPFNRKFGNFGSFDNSGILRDPIIDGRLYNPLTHIRLAYIPRYTEGFPGDFISYYTVRFLLRGFNEGN